MKRIAAFTIAAALLLRGPRVETGAQAAASGRLLVLSKGALTLSVVDPVTLRVIGKAPSGPANRVKFTPDGKNVLVSKLSAAAGST